jgi:HEAT repeat protein
MKAVEPETEPVAEEAPPPEPEPEQESLLGDLGDHVMPVKKDPAPLPLKADKALLSEESLYADDDPLDKLKPQKKGLPASGSSANAAKVSGRVPAVPAKISNRNMAAVPAKISNRNLPPVETPPEPEPVLEEVVEEIVEETPKSSKKMPPAKASVRTAPPISKRGIPPAKAAPPPPEPEPEELAEPVEPPAPAEASEELEVQEEAKAPAKKGMSSRIQRKDSRVMKAGASSRRGAVKEEPAEEEDDSRTSRRRTVREKSVKKGFTKLHMILAGVAVLLVLVVVVGYGPFMHYWLVDKKFLAQGASVDERKKVANEIFDFYRDSNGVALGIFSDNAKSADGTIKEASIYGLEMCAKVQSTRTDVIREAGDGLKTADATSKPLYIHAMGICAEAALEPVDSKLAEKARDDQIRKDRDDMSKIAEVLMPFTDIARESDLTIRSATVDVLAKLQVIGVCQQMIKIAESSDSGLLAKARGAIASTALPDAAAEILDAMGKKDNDLQIVARQAFTRICDQAKSEIIAKAVTNEAPEVRKEVVKALSVRKTDSAATGGLLQAIKDKLPEIRAAAVAGFPTTGLAEKSVVNLAPLVTDSDESVRVATADTLGKLKDTESQKLVIEAFKNEMHGSTQQAFVRALGLRCPNKKTQLQESLKAIKIVMDVLQANPDSAKNVCEALALLTQADAGMSRVNERRGWDVDRWKKWYGNITERESMRADTMAKLEELRKKKDDDHATFGRLFKETEVQLDRLQKCSDMCSPNDPEDAPAINSDLQHFMILKEHFGKNAFLNER